MDITKWNLDEAKIVWYMEGFEEGLEDGREKAREKARKLDREEAFEEGLKKNRARDSELINIAAARKALAKGLSIEVIHNITGLDIEAIKRLVSNPA